MIVGVGGKMSKICPNCNRPLDEHYVAKSATLNRPHVYICPTNVCPVDELFEEVPVAPAQPADFERGRLQGREEILSIIDGTFGSKQLAEKIRKLELAAQPAGEFDDKKS